MNSREDRERQLAQWADQTLKALPARRAPRDLTMRVLGEIERRARLPWYRREFGQWPMAARISFLVILAACVKGALEVADWLVGNVESAPAVSSISPEVSWIKALLDAGAAVVQSIPSIWVYGVLAVMALLYGTLFGLGTAAYRTLYEPR